MQRIALTQALKDLRTNCWGDPASPSVPYAGQKIGKLSLLIPSNESGTQAFDFCVDTLILDGQSVAWGKSGSMSASPNPFGRSARWIVYSDKHTKWITPSNGTDFEGQVGYREGGPVCVKGVVSQVINGDYASTWGAGVAFASSPADLYLPSFENVTLVLSGSHVPKDMRLAIDDYVEGRQSTTWCLKVN